LDIGQRLIIEPSYPEDAGDMTRMNEAIVGRNGFLAVSRYRKDLQYHHHHHRPATLVVPDNIRPTKTLPFEKVRCSSLWNYYFAKPRTVHFDKLRLG
jgi:hypothetical protein